VTRDPDPIIRRVLIYDRARARVHRRVDNLLDYLNADCKDMPACGDGTGTRPPDAMTRRLDDLLGQADRLRRALA
jgi:uncharacterized protein YijF (DUF1287 family)